MSYISFSQRGFTLIELLVVIAIIGILSSVVTSNLSTARIKGYDVAIKADLSGIRTTSDLEYETLGNKYGSTLVSGAACSTLTTANSIFANTSIQNALKHAKDMAGADGYCNLKADGSAFAIAYPLKTPNTYWCIDSVGTSRSTNSSGTAYAALTDALTNSTDYTCN